MKQFHAFPVIAALSTLLIASASARAQGVVIPTDATQNDFLKAYAFVLNQSNADYRFTSATIDTTLFPRWGEYSLYWVKSGPLRGSFIYPDALPASSGITAKPYAGYDWSKDDHYAIAFKAYQKTVGILRSSITANGTSVNWEAVHFKNIFESFLLSSIWFYTDEREIDTAGIPWTTQLLIIPAFTMKGSDGGFYIDSLFAATPRLKDRLLAYLSRGGTIYTEGNAVSLVEKLGLLSAGSIRYDLGVRPDPATNLLPLDAAADNPVGVANDAAGGTIYAGTVPNIDPAGADIIARAAGGDIPVVFSLTGAAARNGRILCNTALPAVGGSNGIHAGSPTDRRQLQWVFNAILYAFAVNVDVTRSVWNDIPDTLTAGRNAASYDRRDTLEIRVRLRNLSASDVDGVQVTESIRDYFRFVDVTTPGVTSSYTAPTLTLSGISIPAHAERIIVYRIATPDPADPVHEKINAYLSWASYLYASYGMVSYADAEGFTSYRKYRDYVDMMFSARITADADLNWKNFLSLNYQPFKVFMIMENKERTAALGTRYVQYIPKDVPFYWVDKTANVPILRTPGGKYVDVLRGSNDQNHPEYDMDHDGRPDAWLDTASIYPKNYTLEETSVYWLNPWEHRTPGAPVLYEDIDHDGKRAQDTDGDGVVDIEEPGDKIRAWKVTWNVGTVPGYQFFDPYCSYELWVDPPDLVPMAAGVGAAYGRLDTDVPGMFYPYSPDVHQADLADTSWTYWMDRDASGAVAWKQLIYQKIHNYEGFTFIDTAKTGYRLLGSDACAGTVPQPHREFIAVLSMGGEEIDMNSPVPKRSLYSNVEYTTIFNERRTAPIRTTYSYYAPLPNPLQFEYVTNNFTITDPAGGGVLRTLPAYGKANLTFDIDASTEYTYYWIRNAGHDVDFNDPSQAREGMQELGDGVFGYMIYDIPKGMGGYKITLPKKPDGTYDIGKIVSVDGRPYAPWIRNPNTQDSVQILEDPFVYHVFIPQLLIPPALDDDNGDGIDDWIDDRGDRFRSSTGFLHDAFMPGNGEDYPQYPRTPFKDDIYGMVTQGWFPGADSTYGDDFFENLGKTHVTITAQYEGAGREGSVDISKGGWLVVEEIFGGSPWVLMSHALSAYSQGVNYALTSRVTPSVARYGVDTVCIKHVIEDVGEPHAFDARFDPYHVSYGYGSTTITTFAGGKDPCELISPAVPFSTIIDPQRDRRTVTLLPQADTANPDLKTFPKTASGSFLEVRIEISNGTDWNWINTTVTPALSAAVGATSLVMSYVAYPRPLVPAQVDPATGAVIRTGDDIGAFRAGWRFNQPEGEVLVKMGSTLNLMQPTRRAYFVFLFAVDPSLPKGIYQIDFTLSGGMRKYDGTFMRDASFDVPPAMFSVSTRDAKGAVTEYQKLVIGQANLTALKTDMNGAAMRGMQDVRWSKRDIAYTDFDTLADALPAVYTPATGTETVDLSQFGAFPTAACTRLYLLERGQVTSYASTERMDVTRKESLQYETAPGAARTATQGVLSLSTVGPKVILYKAVEEVNGSPLPADSIPRFDPGQAKSVRVVFEASNQGGSIAENVVLTADPGPYFSPDPAQLPANARITGSRLELTVGSLLPGESRETAVIYRADDAVCRSMYDSSAVVSRGNATYTGAYAISGTSKKSVFTVPDAAVLDLPAYDLRVERLTSARIGVRRGGDVALYAKLDNGVVPADGAAIGFYAVVNGDTSLVDLQPCGRLEPHSTSIVQAHFIVPDTATTLAFFAKADPADRFGEFCESNNAASMTMPILGLDWILDVTNYPNPARGDTRISYLLPRDIRDLTFTLYALDGRRIVTHGAVPGDIGRHDIPWIDASAAAGVYYYTFEGYETTGEKRVHTGRLVKLGAR